MLQNFQETTILGATITTSFSSASSASRSLCPKEPSVTTGSRCMASEGSHSRVLYCHPRLAKASQTQVAKIGPSAFKNLEVLTFMLICLFCRGGV